MDGGDAAPQQEKQPTVPQVPEVYHVDADQDSLVVQVKMPEFRGAAPVDKIEAEAWEVDQWGDPTSKACSSIIVDVGDEVCDPAAAGALDLPGLVRSELPLSHATGQVTARTRVFSAYRQVPDGHALGWKRFFQFSSNS
jgi:hypothetical protein